MFELIPLNTSHTSSAIMTSIIDIITKWDIKEEQITGIIHDNAQNMKSAFS